MKCSFILLDHSIEDSTGHQLEYARRVLGAAKIQGFRTVLGVNKRADEICCPEADCIDKAFSHTYWENQAINPVRLATSIIQWGNRVAGNSHFSRLYANEFRDFARRVGARSGDLIFAPTLGAAELTGISLYTVARGAETFEWHLLFRRDLPDPKNIFHVKELINLRRVKEAFNEFNSHFDKERNYFYTDTAELSAHYNGLGIFPFLTLPIPINDSLTPRKRMGKMPLVVSYLGDARVEKGFHLLPKLIKDLHSAGWEEDRVKFRIQANLPLAGSIARVAHVKKTLARMEGAGLEILEGPFDSNQYHMLIHSSDVILLPYCTMSYQARSSGIFAEALAAGIPTVYPRGSWMEECAGDSGSVRFGNSNELSSALIMLLSCYPEYESRSWNFSDDWRKVHSATNLVKSLTKHHPDPVSPEVTA
jgi:hypothetical protein